MFIWFFSYHPYVIKVLWKVLHLDNVKDVKYGQNNIVNDIGEADDEYRNIEFG
jgi:hypothetical protein